MSPGKSTDEELDQELADSFPASDPPSLTEPVGDARKTPEGRKPQPKLAKRPRRPKT